MNSLMSAVEQLLNLMKTPDEQVMRPWRRLARPDDEPDGQPDENRMATNEN